MKKHEKNIREIAASVPKSGWMKGKKTASRFNAKREFIKRNIN